MMAFVEVTKRALMLTLLLALREAAAGALVQAMGRFSKKHLSHYDGKCSGGKICCGYTDFGK